MNLDLSCISGEVYNIINNRKKHDCYVVLMCFGIREIMSTIKQIKLIPAKFIMYLTYMENYIQCYIDFDLLEYLHNNKIFVTIIDNNDFLSLSNSISSSSSDEFETKITKMLVNDSNTVNKLNESKNNIFTESLFNEIDTNNDGLITAIDILNIIDNERFIFNDAFINKITNLLYDCDKISYELFATVYL